MKNVQILEMKNEIFTKQNYINKEKVVLNYLNLNLFIHYIITHLM